MLIDRYATRHSSKSDEAVRAFEKAVHGVATHRPSTGDALTRALWADPDLVAGHALKGFASVILGRDELIPAARQACEKAIAAAQAQGGATESETVLIEALEFAAEGRLLSAAARLEAHLGENPTEFLAAKLAHALRFMGGDLRGMLVATSRLVDRLPESAPGYGFLLGCHAFGLEEAGEFASAERAGRRAVEIEPEDAWGIHAVSHVHEMSGRVREGVAWLERDRASWSRCNNFSFHISWHLALFHLERGDHARVLALYDREVRPQATDDFRDVANAVSLLWRLEQEGIAVGQRWGELGEIALKRRSDTTLTFASLHYLLALVATKETAAAAELVSAIGAKAVSAEGDQATVMDVVGRDLARTILGLATSGVNRTAIDRLATRLPMIGGSHAQRDVFVRSLAMLAAERGDRATLDRVLAIRRRLKREDRFALLVRERLRGAAAQPIPLSA